ncbi:MAG: universal stress protein [Acidobacteriia bacterium]|nr:universal stress protein [Terriglobia bacterium]
MYYEPVRLKHGSQPAPPDVSENSRKLDLQVIFTDLPKTAAALAKARSMARGLGARITLMVARVVPYPLPLAEPDVPVEFTEHLLEPLAREQDNARDDADIAIEIYLCRDRSETIRRAVPPDSLVIVGAPKRRWWPSGWFPWERSLARMLRRDGRRVLVVTV